MKKYLFLATAAIAALASCTSDDFVGDKTAVTSQNENGAISFGTGVDATTRADKTGAEAAEELNKNFVVGGFKGAESVATTLVFDNYNVNYTENTANTTESNTSNWEYVGQDVNSLATIPNENSEKQTIKYWDYSQAQYDFIAYSLGTGGATVTAITPSTATSSTGGAYTLTGTTAQLKTVHIADLVTVQKANYNKVVQFKFRSFASKVRLGLYETVPGYSVKDVKFYTSDAAIDGGSTNTEAALYASTSVLPTSGKYTVYFPTVNSAGPASDKNKAHVEFTTSTTTATQTNQTFGELATDKLVSKENHEYTDDTNKDLLGRSSNNCTFAGTTANNYYTEVLPLETGTSLTLKVDYTLISTDGSGETIKVVGAKAVVPAVYAQWKPGYAYTYIFKISDNTNGYTSKVESEEVQGLHAITFDAVVEESTEHNQETVTTVATPSITTYQHVPAVNASANNEYKAGEIYAMVTEDGTLKGDLDAKAKFYKLNKAATEAEVMDALLMQTKVESKTIYGRNGITLTPATIDNSITTIPGADGNNVTVVTKTASKLTVEANNSYAYVYTVTEPVAGTEKYELKPVAANADVSGLYTYNGSTYTEASGTAVAETKYYEKYTPYTATYAVKVIKVAAGS